MHRHTDLIISWTPMVGTKLYEGGGRFERTMSTLANPAGRSVNGIVDVRMPRNRNETDQEYKESIRQHTYTRLTSDIITAMTNGDDFYPVSEISIERFTLADNTPDEGSVTSIIKYDLS